MMQAFEWYVPADQKHWKRLQSVVGDLKATGIDNIWVPPGCKASSPNGNGYDIYDLYDLGEFDIKGGMSTKWGSKEDLLQLSEKASEVGVGLYWDAVLNHKAAADEKEKCLAVEVDPNGSFSCPARCRDRRLTYDQNVPKKYLGNTR
jgi:alpha-amylase